MKKAGMFGVLLIIGGIVSILLSSYISEQVKEGKVKIEKGQRTIDVGSSLFSRHPVAKEVGKGLSSSAQKKIDEGKEQVTHYTFLAKVLMICGIVAVVVGAGLMVYSFKKHRS